MADLYPLNFTESFVLCLDISMGSTKQTLIIFIFVIQEKIWNFPSPIERVILYPGLHPRVILYPGALSAKLRASAIIL
jgi:hypothetical protein